MTRGLWKGSHSWELQIGKLVVQVRRLGRDRELWGSNIKRVNVFIDPFGRWL